jgi:LacI family transcriptional regulator
MVTMADVARVAGVSITTVSHVVNGTRPTSPHTAQRVHAAIERTGYSQNTIARALARARTQSIGLAISGLGNPYFTDVIAAVEARAGRAGHTVLLGDTHDDPEQELRIVRALVERRVDGLLLSPSPSAGEHALRYLAAQELPVVLLDRFLPAGLDQGGTENERPTAALVEHLAGLGHRRIAMVAGLAGVSTTDERVRGYRLALARRGLPEDGALVVEGGSNSELARAAALRLLELPEPPTAIVSGNNVMTIGVLRALAERSLRVPDDVALVAFDDFEWADLFAPRLTVVRQPTAQLGERAVELLLSRLEAPGTPARTVRLDATFVHRDSCGCALTAAGACDR